MKILGRKEIESLIETRSDCCISIYLPVHRLGDQQDSIRYKNLLDQAKGQLIDRGWRSAEAVKLLAPEHELTRVVEYWSDLGADGLAVFLSGNRRKRYPLPRKFEESVTVANHFRIKPLIPLITGLGSFFILALNKNKTRLYLGSRYNITETVLPEEAPASMEEALHYDDPQSQLQFHTKTSGSRDRREAMFHGHGVGIDEARENTVRFFQQLAGKLHPVFIEQQIPVVLAGVESLPPLYREQDRSGLLIEAAIESNPEAMTQQVLHEMAWKLVGPIFAEKEKDDREKFDELHGTGRTSTDITEILVGAEGGRVETLFVVENSEQWGSFDPDEGRIEIAAEDVVGTVDLYDLAVTLTLKNGGTVYVNRPDEMPAPENIAALLRY